MYHHLHGLTWHHTQNQKYVKCSHRRTQKSLLGFLFPADTRHVLKFRKEPFKRVDKMVVKCYICKTEGHAIQRWPTTATTNILQPLYRSTSLMVIRTSSLYLSYYKAMENLSLTHLILCLLVHKALTGQAPQYIACLLYTSDAADE